MSEWIESRSGGHERARRHRRAVDDGHPALRRRRAHARRLRPSAAAALRAARRRRRAGWHCRFTHHAVCTARRRQRRGVKAHALQFAHPLLHELMLRCLHARERRPGRAAISNSRRRGH